MKYWECFLEVWCHGLPGTFSCLWTPAEVSFTSSAREGADRLDENMPHALSQLAVSCWWLLFLSRPHSYASNKSVPFHLLFLTENASLNISIFSWISYAFQSYTKASISDSCFSPVMSLCQTCTNFEDLCHKSVTQHLDICQEQNRSCLPTWTLPAVLLNNHKTQPKPNKANILQAFTSSVESSSAWTRKESRLLFKFSEEK